MVELRNPSPASLNEFIIGTGPGTGYGGRCFTKEARNAREHSQALHMLERIEALNRDQKQVLGYKEIAKISRNLVGKIFALWGVAFKLKTYPDYSAR